MISLTRRKFVKLSTAAASLAAVGFGVRSPKAQAEAIDLVKLLVVDPLTLEYKVFSPCCYLCPTYLVVSHYQPVIFCEVIKGQDSIAGVSTLKSPLQVGVDENGYTAFHVRLWEIPDWAVEAAMAGQACKLCGTDFAYFPTIADSSDAGTCGAATDSLLTNMVGDITDEFSCVPKMIYSTESDPTWNTGCRDWAKTLNLGDFRCSVGAGNIGGGLFGKDRCIGSHWGPVYPRQMASNWDNPNIAAAVAAYRALNVARNALGVVDYDTSVSLGKLQQTVPNITIGYPPGSTQAHNALVTKKISNSVAGMNHQFGFVWWVPVVCCKDYNEIFGVCTPTIGCFGM